MINDTLVFNGIDGRTGAYLPPSVDVAQLARTWSLASPSGTFASQCLFWRFLRRRCASSSYMKEVSMSVDGERLFHMTITCYLSLSRRACCTNRSLFVHVGGLRRKSFRFCEGRATHWKLVDLRGLDEPRVSSEARVAQGLRLMARLVRQ
jgi:hypothetical protein